MKEEFTGIHAHSNSQHVTINHICFNKIITYIFFTYFNQLGA